MGQRRVTRRRRPALWGSAEVSVTFVNVRQLGSVKITKTDDASPGNPLAGAEFTLYEDNPPTGGTRGGGDIATNKTCTTDADGTCTITGVLPGEYWVVETKTRPTTTPPPTST